MIYYKDINNKVHALESKDFEHVLPPKCIEITETEAYDITHPPATVEELKRALQADRNTALNNIKHDFGDGRIMQVRPQDLNNIRGAIDLGADQEWVLDDAADTLTTILSVVELQTALDDGYQRASVIWDQYIADLKAL